MVCAHTFEPHCYGNEWGIYVDIENYQYEPEENEKKLYFQ